MKKGAKAVRAKSPNRYSAIISEIFRRHYRKGAKTVAFDRTEFADVAKKMNIELPKNLGDAIYSFKFRASLPSSISSTAPAGMEWIISNAGIAKYEFRLVRPVLIRPNADRILTKIPDATPEIITAYALGDEQALLAKVRYNRLIDIFLGISASSLQNHLRTTVKGIGQIEVDELYVGVDRFGAQYVIPVQAKGGRDKHGQQQTEQDLACCAEKFPTLKCRAVSAQFMAENTIAMFELGIQKGRVVVISEEHYELTAASEISKDDLETYATRGLR